MAAEVEAKLEDAEGMLQACGHAERRRYETKGSDLALVRQMPAATVNFSVPIFPSDPPTLETKSGETLPSKQGPENGPQNGGRQYKRSKDRGPFSAPHFFKTVAAFTDFWRPVSALRPPRRGNGSIGPWRRFPKAKHRCC